MILSPLIFGSHTHAREYLFAAASIKKTAMCAAELIEAASDERHQFVELDNEVIDLLHKFKYAGVIFWLEIGQGFFNCC
jgi:hypothetical protein